MPNKICVTSKVVVYEHFLQSGLCSSQLNQRVKRLTSLTIVMKNGDNAALGTAPPLPPPHTHTHTYTHTHTPLLWPATQRGLSTRRSDRWRSEYILYTIIGGGEGGGGGWPNVAVHRRHCFRPPMIWGEQYWSVHLGVLNISTHEETEQVGYNIICR